MKGSMELQRDVLDELAWEPSLDAAGLGVAVHEGIVTLSGQVNSYLDKRVAIKAAKRVGGVRGIADDMEVHLPSSMQRDDTDIAQAGVRALEWNNSVPRNRVKVLAENGWITLEGDVEWQYQKKAAEKAVANLTGVHGVTNQITVKPRVQPANVESKIRSAFTRHAELDADEVHVEVAGTKITLRGNVRSWGEYEQAEWAAWSVPGATDVENFLRVRQDAPALL